MLRTFRFVLVLGSLGAYACRTQLLQPIDGGGDGPPGGDGFALFDASASSDGPTNGMSDASIHGDGSTHHGDGGPQHGDGGPQHGDGGPQHGDGGPQHGDASLPVDGSILRAPDGAILPDMAQPVPFLTSTSTGWPTTLYDYPGNVVTDYVASNDSSTLFGGAATREVRSTSSATVNDCGYDYQIADSLGPWIGHRVRMTAALKSTLGAQSYAGLYFEVYGPSTDVVLDDMSNRRVVGNTVFTTFSLVLDVDSSPLTIYYGGYMCGLGEIWIGNATFEVVSDSVPVTETYHNP